MYLRHSIVRKDGKTHTYWRLVRSVRRNGKVIQETVAQLGELDTEGRAKAKARPRVWRRVAGLDALAGPAAGRAVRGGAGGGAGGGALGADGVRSGAGPSV